MVLVKKPEWEKLSGYFNLDNGTGKIRGVYLQENEAEAPLFEAWMQPFKDLGMTTLTMRNTGGTDHLSFDAAGIPGFQFIQDPLDYETRTHHSNMDVYDRLQADDLRQAAVIVASFVYNAAVRDAMLPRKPIEIRAQAENLGGAVLVEGSPEEIAGDRRVREVYLGSAAAERRETNAKLHLAPGAQAATTSVRGISGLRTATGAAVDAAGRQERDVPLTDDCLESRRALLDLVRRLPR